MATVIELDGKRAVLEGTLWSSGYRPLELLVRAHDGGYDFSEDSWGPAPDEEGRRAEWVARRVGAKVVVRRQLEEQPAGRVY